VWQEINRKKPSIFHRSRKTIEIDEAFWSRLRGIARHEAATPFMVVLTGLGVLLNLTTCSEKIRIGTLVANRRRETEKVIGHFLNTLVLCLHIEPKMTFKQLLTQVRQTTLSAFLHQELPFERLAQMLKEEKNVDRAATFQVLLSYQMTRFVAVEHSCLQIAPLTWQRPASDTELTPTTFDMIFTLRETPAKLVGDVNYWSGIPRTFVAHVNGSLNSVLRQMGANIETRISSVCLKNH